jgi:hypothetical protein
MNKPYVISAELDLSPPGLKEMIEQDNLENFRADLDANLQAIGKETVWVDSVGLQAGIRRLQTGQRRVVSLDDRYVTAADVFLGISRSVDPRLQDTGYVPRAGYADITTQLARVPQLGGEIVVVDDVLFSGEMVSWLADQLQPYGVRIGAVVCGIAIQEGIDKLALENIPVEAVEVFPEVEDEICERDFAFVPGSGRRVAGRNANALYFDNTFGKPAQWASIPQPNTEAFCAMSLERNLQLVRPHVAAAAIGTFLGYGSQGNVRQVLQSRLERMS